jgi:N-acetylglucosaminyldiphosphoundecaprenol N-acetyl-beta-D-mannosaminyltransferase
MHKLLALADEKGYRVYLFGGRQEILETCVATIQQRYPKVRIAGSRNGYFLPTELPDIVTQINTARPDILFIGINSPTKEQLADKWKKQIHATIIQGVGGSFDVLAGIVPRAPLWVQRAGFEWLYRVLQEPRRMFWRYAKTNAQCLWIFACALTGRR